MRHQVENHLYNEQYEPKTLLRTCNPTTQETRGFLSEETSTDASTRPTSKSPGFCPGSPQRCRTAKRPQLRTKTRALRSLKISTPVEHNHPNIQIFNSHVIYVYVCINACIHTNAGNMSRMSLERYMRNLQHFFLGKAVGPVGGKSCKGDSLFVIYFSPLDFCNMSIH